MFAGAAKDGGLWSAVLEKAWAKVNGNYDSIAAGHMVEAMNFLTGAPSIDYTNTDPSTINSIGQKAWDIINDAD